MWENVCRVCGTIANDKVPLKNNQVKFLEIKYITGIKMSKDIFNRKFCYERMIWWVED